MHMKLDIENSCNFFLTLKCRTHMHSVDFFSCPPVSSLSRSETTSTGRGTRSSAWPGWPKMSWPRSPTSCCPSWRAEGSSRGRHSPPRRCRTSASTSELLPRPTPLLLHPSPLPCSLTSTIICRSKVGGARKQDDLPHDNSTFSPPPLLCEGICIASRGSGLPKHNTGFSEKIFELICNLLSQLWEPDRQTLFNQILAGSLQSSSKSCLEAFHPKSDKILLCFLPFSQLWWKPGLNTGRLVGDHRSSCSCSWHPRHCNIVATLE